MNTSEIIKLLTFWKAVAEKDELFEREISKKIPIEADEVIDIVGPRRSGKSSLLKLIARKLKNKGDFLYVNFEDPFFVDYRNPKIIETLLDVAREHLRWNIESVFFDEIQAIEHWERAVHKLRELKTYKIFLSGSSAKLLAGELGTLLSGRHLSFTLLPLSFREYLAFQNAVPKNNADLVIRGRRILEHFSHYLATGGFPEVVKGENTELLKQYFFDIIQKDIIRRYEIRDRLTLEKMALFLVTNSAKPVSIASLKKTFGISFELASAYLRYFQEAFLLFLAPQFSYSLKTQQKAAKKAYAVDTGLAAAVSFQFSEEKGRMLENCIFLELVRQYTSASVYYYRTHSRKEVDFFVTDQNKHRLFQVAWTLSDPAVKKREVGALLEAMDELSLSRAIIVTYEEEERIEKNERIIEVVPAYQWLLQQNGI